jgi:hypothetical protein
VLTRPAPSPAAARIDRTDVLGWLGLFFLITPWLIRATTLATTLPVWDLDPLAYVLPSTSLTPTGSLLCDGISLLGSACLLLFAGRRDVPLALPLILLGLIGAAAIVLHGWMLGPTHGSLGDQRIGAAWLSAVLGAVALWHAAQVGNIRRIAVGTLLGLIVLLALYGAVQVFWIHKQTVDEFNANPDRVLAAHGWPKDSPMAKAFIRRLIQPEAIGWFGLANVYATITAAAAVCAHGLLVAAFKKVARKLLLPAIFAALASFAVILSFSKGGIIAAVIGLAALVVLHVLSRTSNLTLPSKRRLAGIIGLAAIAGPIALIILRGQVGERSHELSLFFRWFYVQASCRIFAENPVIGVGPDGYQRAFTLAKPPLCPEEVSSPHGVVFDWTATLGVLGIAWICLLGRMAWRACSDAVAAPQANSTDPAPTPLSRPEARVMLAIPVAATLIAVFIESALVTPEVAIVRIVGVVLWCVATWAIAREIDRTAASRIALAAGALVLIAHGQIDVAGSLPSSVGVWFALIALAAAPDAARETKIGNRAGVGHKATAALFAALGILSLHTCLRTVRPWEQRLDEAADAIHPIADISERLTSLSKTPSDSLAAIARDLERALGHPLKPGPDGLGLGMNELERRLLPIASEKLQAAFQIEPSDRRPLREASRLQLRLAEQAAVAGDQPEVQLQTDRALEVLRIDLQPGPASTPVASDWHWFASVHEHVAELLRDPSHISRAITARYVVAQLDPYNLENAKHIVQDASAVGDHALARHWAAKCLELNDDMRLDREVRGLSDAELKSLKELANAP